MKRQHLETFVLATILTAWIVVPQMESQQTVAAVPQLLNRAPSVNSGYVLGAGDQVNIHVVDLQEYSDKTLQIDPDGILDLPFLGQLRVSGETVDSFKAQLRSRLSTYIDSPQITVSVLTIRSSKVSVIGEVNSPGIRQLSGPTTLIEAISEAGGVKADAGSKIVITRSLDAGTFPIDGQIIDTSGHFSTVSVSLDDLMLAKRPADNFMLRPGDVLSIPKASIVYVLGDVHRPGGFPISSRSSMSVLQALSLAEGLTQNNASGSAKILRPAPGGDGNSAEIPVNVKAILTGKNLDIPLLAEDILYIPHSTAEAGAKRAAEIVLQVATGVLIYR